MRRYPIVSPKSVQQKFFFLKKKKILHPPLLLNEFRVGMDMGKKSLLLQKN